MLPSYVYTPKPVKNHIHLGFLPDNLTPTGLGPHNEPPYEFHVQKRQPITDMIVSLTRTWSYRPIDQIKHIDGQALKFIGYRYELRVTPDKFELLRALAGNKVLLVDNFHCEDNEDHAPFTRKMLFDEFPFQDALDPMQQYVIVNIGFKDLDTVAVKARTL